MPRTKVTVVAEVATGLWSNAIRAGDMLFISGQVARPFEGGTGIVGRMSTNRPSKYFHALIASSKRPVERWTTWSR
jgi:hypothetical protein